MAKPAKKDILEIIDNYRDQVIDIQRELVSRPALSPVNGGEGEWDKVMYMRSLMEELGPREIIQVDAPDPNAKYGVRPNVLAYYGPEKGPKVVVLSHADIVPPGDLGLWESNPFELRVEGDKLIGRGVEDNNHGFISPYIALKAMLQNGIGLKQGICLVVVSDEETGSKYGLNYILNEYPQLFSKDDIIVVPDGGNEEGTMIEVAEKSMLWLKVAVTGKQCHASTPQKGNNALVAAAKFIVGMEKIRERFSTEDPIYSPPCSTLEPTRILENVPNVNTIPGHQVFYLDCRILPSTSLKQVLEAFHHLASQIEQERKVSIEIEPVLYQEAPSPTPVDSKVVRHLSEAIKKVKDKEPVIKGIGGGTVAAFFRQKALPAAVWHTSHETAHQPNEWCRVSTILEDAKVFALLYNM